MRKEGGEGEEKGEEGLREREVGGECDSRSRSGAVWVEMLTTRTR